jgi:hypothetical protein
MQSVGEQLGIGNLENFRPHPALVSADAVGVELELEGFTSRSTEEAQRHLHPLWTTTQDGSLRNGGVELITNGGLGGEQLHSAFERVASLLERINYDASWRCSTHMHINMRDFTVNQVVRFMLVYAACEPVLFAHCGKFRYSSNFCVPIADSMPFHKKLISRLYDNVVRSRTAAQHTVKYTAMNFQPLFGDGRNRPALGTVEFRGGRPMTTTAEFVLQANLLLSIKQFVRESTETEPEMLTRLNEGVLNTVYANGCAAELTVDAGELDEALVHAWILLKSYQKGMKQPQQKTPSEAMAETLAGLRSNPGAARAIDRLTMEQVEALGFWNPGDMTGLQRPQPLNVDRASNPRYIQYCERTSRDNNAALTPTQSMVEMAQVIRGEFRFSEDIACCTAALWYMNLMDAQRFGYTPTTGPRVIMELVNANSRGHVTWTHAGRPVRQQPRFTWGSARFNYLGGVTEEERNDITRHTGAISTRAIYEWVLTTEVRIKRADTLIAALEARGLRGVNFPSRASGTQYCQAALLSYLLKVADFSSIDYVHAGHLGLYDKAVLVVEILQSRDLSVPIFKHYSHAGRGLIRCEHTMDSPMGHNIPREVVINPAPQRQLRRSETTNRDVY